MPLELQPRPKIRYKQPHRLNAVSIVFFAMLGLLGYAGYAIWPAFSLRSNVESELADALSSLWRLNQNPDSAIRFELEKLKRHVVERVRQVGVKDKKLEVVFDRNKKKVAMEARFTTSFTFPGTNRTVDLRFRPRVETDAARVEW